jgi:DNA-directed RNA polymerase subunit L
MSGPYFTNFNKQVQRDGTQLLTFTLQNTNVAYANTLRRLVLTGVESVAFRSDMNDMGTSTDVSIIKNSTSMTNEMLADRIGLLPIRWNTAKHGAPGDYLFKLNVKNTTDRLLDVTSSNITAVRLVGKDGKEEEIPKDAMDFFDAGILLTVLKPYRANHEPQEIEFTAKASIGIGKEHARFIPVSQCAYRYTRDTNPQRQEELMLKWAKSMNKITGEEAAKPADISEEKRALLRKEYETMEIDRCYLTDLKTGEANSFDFTVETIGTVDARQIIEEAVKKAQELCQRYTSFTREMPRNLKPPVACSNRLEGWDFTFTVPERYVDNTVTKEDVHREHILDLLSCDHTLGNLLQTYVDENLFGQNNVTYIGYNVPHPLRNDMVLRIGIHEGDQANARITIELAAKGCVKMFTDWLADWQKTAGMQIAAKPATAAAAPKSKKGLKA